jgi:tetratricopeptide (TPR) repeat protein
MSHEAYCRIAHPQIASGTCPGCQQVFGEGQDHRWDIPRMDADVVGGDPYTLEVTAWNLKYSPPDILPALPLYRKLLLGREEDAAIALALHGGKLTDDEAGSLEASTLDQPDDLALRIALLGYYSQRQSTSDAHRKSRLPHVLAVIERWPRSHIAGTPFAHLIDRHRDGRDFEIAKAAWLRQIEANPNDPRVMGNAANFFLHEDPTKAGELLRRARDLDPGNPEWSQRIGHLYSLEEIRADEAAGRDWAAMALAEMERGLREANGSLDHLHSVAGEAFKAGELAKARAYASELLQKADLTDPGTAIFYGNQVLGLVCLAEGDVATAKTHLLESGKTVGSPVLGSFGPDMDLANGLLGAGERVAVLEYLRLCSNFWTMGREKLTLWKDEIERGGTPAKWPSRF